MTGSVTHTFVSAVADGGDATLVRPSNWNAAHTLAGICVNIGQVTTSGSQATVTFSSIPGTYNNLKIVYSGQDSSAGVSDSNLRLQMNGDATSGNYSSTVQSGTQNAASINNSPSASSAGGVIGLLPGSANGGGLNIGCGEILIPAYAGTTFNKVAQALSTEFYSSTTTGYVVAARSFVWVSTAAITSLVLTPSGSGWKDNSVVTLYGMN